MDSHHAPLALVVDDDVLVLFHACDILQDAGFKLREAANGEEATTLLEEIGAEVTLLFTDVEMPGALDGFALARYVANCWPEMEIVVASGRIVPRPGDLPAKATYVGKPFSADIIKQHLQQMLPEHKKPAPLRSAS